MPKYLGREGGKHGTDLLVVAKILPSTLRRSKKERLLPPCSRDRVRRKGGVKDIESRGRTGDILIGGLELKGGFEPVAH